MTLSRDLRLLLRTAAVSAHLRQLDPNILATIRTMKDSWDEPKAGSRLHQAFAFSFLAALALLMSGTGIFDVLSHMITPPLARNRKRMALGAIPRQVLMLVLRQSLLFALGGIAVGLTVDLLAAPHLASLLFNVHPRDSIFLAATAAFLLLLALLAAFAPARRAALMDPARTLRSQ